MSWGSKLLASSMGLDAKKGANYSLRPRAVFALRYFLSAVFAVAGSRKSQQCFEGFQTEHLLDRFAHDDRKHRPQLLSHARECRIDGNGSETEVVCQRRIQLFIEALTQPQV